MGLDRKDHGVKVEPGKRLGDADVGSYCRRPIGECDCQPVFSYGRQGGAARDDVHVVSTGTQARGHQTTYRASTDNTEFHA